MTEPQNFTVKEMLTSIVIPDLKAIKASLDAKADRAEVNALESRLAHFEAAEASYIKRTGPVMDEIRRSTARLDEIDKDIIRRNTLVDRYLVTEKIVQQNTEKLHEMPSMIRAEIDGALRTYDARKEKQSDRSFSRRDRVLLAVFAGIGLIATIISTVFLVVNTTGGHS